MVKLLCYLWLAWSLCKEGKCFIVWLLFAGVSLALSKEGGLNIAKEANFLIFCWNNTATWRGLDTCLCLGMTLESGEKGLLRRAESTFG